MALDEVISECVAKWQGERIRLAPPIAEADLRRLWAGLGRSASGDVVRLYGTVGGFEDGGSDDEFYWSLWTGEMIREENEERPGEGVLFCDHSIELVLWELRYEDEGRSSVWRTGPSGQVAPSLEAFLRLYLEDPWDLLWAPA